MAKPDPVHIFHASAEQWARYCRTLDAMLRAGALSTRDYDRHDTAAHAIHHRRFMALARAVEALRTGAPTNGQA